MNSLDMKNFVLNKNEVEYNDQNTYGRDDQAHIDEIEASDPSTTPRKRAKKEDRNKEENEAAQFSSKNI